MKKSITLINKTINKTHVTETISIDQNGDLLIEGYDVGQAPKEIFGSSTYEHVTTVKAKDKDWLLLLKLLADNFSDRTEIRQWLEKHSVPHQLFAW